MCRRGAFWAAMLTLVGAKLASGQFVSNVTTPSTTTTTLTPEPVTVARDGIIRLKVGLLFPNSSRRLRDLMGFGQSAPAINVALRRVNTEGLINNVNLTFTWYMDNCDESKAAGFTSRLIQTDQVDAIIGPPCATSAIIAGIVATFYNMPIFVWGAATAAELSDGTRFPTLANVNTNTYMLGLGVRELMTQYEWKQFALIYTLDSEQRKCDFLQQDLETAVNEVDSRTFINFKRRIYSSEDSIKQTLRQLKIAARIIVACFDNDADKRNFLIYVNDLGMNTDDYVYIFPDLRSQGMLQQASTSYIDFWADPAVPGDGRDDDAKATARRSIVIDLENQSSATIEQFNREVAADIGQYPFFCDVGCLGGEDERVASVYARSLHDATYMYARALNRSLEDGRTDQLNNGSMLNTYSRGEFEGMTGTVRINENGTRDPVFYVTAFDREDLPQVFSIIAISANYTYDVQYTDEFSTIWASRNMKRPSWKPICGFTGQDCPTDVTVYIVIGSVVIVILIITTLVGIAYIVRERIRERKRLDRECQVPFNSLLRLSHDPKSSEALKSLRSMQSSSSQSTKYTLESHRETEHHAFFVMHREVIYAEKHPVRVKITSKDWAHFRKLRQFDHDNVNRFLGLCLDGPILMSIWKCCQRGSLQDVLARESYISDPFVMFALMRDIANGLLAIHQSFLGVHGSLTSDCCLINDRWQVKIGDYGLDCIRLQQPLARKKFLWMAPELIRANDRKGTKEGDVYSFAIICSELLNRENAWNGAEKDQEIDDIISKVKRGGEAPYRPDLHPPDDVNVNLLHLVRDCWAEDSSNRPRMETVRTLLKQMVKDGSNNLMDYVFKNMEQYTGSLEQEVEERTKELMEEKKKSDILLYRMLPQQVADNLKMGRAIEPESYDMVTVFFSDVVSFTTLASRCTPLQVVNLLNTLYSNFDAIIDNHDAYKVETIGDGYLVCSGLPRRNGDQHAKEIADLAVEFLASLYSFRIPHLPEERINLRIGFHTGPAVAGVVGLTMPRYCLFGDTVNTASRMESNGKPGRIHISATSNHYLTNIIGGYITEPRGEVIIKGKGVMETYWLISRADTSNAYSLNLSATEQAHLNTIPTVRISESPPGTVGDEERPIYSEYRETLETVA